MCSWSRVGQAVTALAVDILWQRGNYIQLRIQFHNPSLDRNDEAYFERLPGSCSLYKCDECDLSLGSQQALQHSTPQPTTSNVRSASNNLAVWSLLSQPPGSGRAVSGLHQGYYPT